MNKLKLAMFRELEAERDELLYALLDVVNQACQEAFEDGKCFVHHNYLSAYEDAIALLEQLGYAKRVPGQFKRWELVWPEVKNDDRIS